MPLTAEQMKDMRTEMLRQLDAVIRAEMDPRKKAEMLATADEQAERMFTDACAEHCGV